MISNEIGLELHDRHTRGLVLSDEEKDILDQWYEEQDVEEANEVSLTRYEVNFPDFQRQINLALESILKMSEQLQQLIQENAKIRAENQTLKEQIAQRLSQQAA